MKELDKGRTSTRRTDPSCNLDLRHLGAKKIDSKIRSFVSSPRNIRTSTGQPI